MPGSCPDQLNQSWGWEPGVRKSRGTPQLGYNLRDEQSQVWREEGEGDVEVSFPVEISSSRGVIFPAWKPDTVAEAFLGEPGR